MNAEIEKKLLELRGRCRKVAALDTAYHAQRQTWKPNTLIGHCKCVAVAVQERFGGKLIHDKIGGVPHIWNELPDGECVDLTAEQFGQYDSITPFKRGKRSQHTQISRRIQTFLDRLGDEEDLWSLSPYSPPQPATDAQPQSR